MIKAIIFDFDGVILESAEIKTRAFAEIVSDYPENAAAEFMKYHMDNMGVSRYIKFKYLIKNILNEDCADEKIQELSARFKNIVHNEIMKCDFVPGAEKFLENFHNEYDLYIASGTPEREIREITVKRGISDHFKGIYGSPRKKEQIADSILKKGNYDNSDVLFVGDAITDLKAAKKCGITFVGRSTPENTEQFLNVEYTVSDLTQIQDICKGLSL